MEEEEEEEEDPIVRDCLVSRSQDEVLRAISGFCVESPASGKEFSEFTPCSTNVQDEEMDEARPVQALDLTPTGGEQGQKNRSEDEDDSDCEVPTPLPNTQAYLQSPSPTKSSSLGKIDTPANSCSFNAAFESDRSQSPAADGWFDHTASNVCFASTQSPSTQIDKDLIRPSGSPAVEGTTPKGTTQRLHQDEFSTPRTGRRRKRTLKQDGQEQIVGVSKRIVKRSLDVQDLQDVQDGQDLRLEGLETQEHSGSRSLDHGDEQIGRSNVSEIPADQIEARIRRESSETQEHDQIRKDVLETKEDQDENQNQGDKSKSSENQVAENAKTKSQEQVQDRDQEDFTRSNRKRSLESQKDDGIAKCDTVRSSLGDEDARRSLDREDEQAEGSGFWERPRTNVPIDGGNAVTFSSFKTVNPRGENCIVITTPVKKVCLTQDSSEFGRGSSSKVKAPAAADEFAKRTPARSAARSEDWDREVESSLSNPRSVPAKRLVSTVVQVSGGKKKQIKAWLVDDDHDDGHASRKKKRWNEDESGMTRVGNVIRSWISSPAKRMDDYGVAEFSAALARIGYRLPPFSC